METAAVDRSKSGGVSDFVKRPALIAGIVTAGGYLFLLFFAAIYSADALAKPLTLAIIGLLAGVAAAILSQIFRGLVRSIVAGGTGLLLIILPLAMEVCPAPGMDATLGGTAPLGIIAMVLLTGLLGSLYARTLNVENAVIRWLLVSLAGALMMMTLIMWLVYIAGGDTAEAIRVSGIFGTDSAEQVVKMVLFIIAAIAELGIFVLALISAVKQNLGAKLAKFALLIAKLLLPVIVLMVLVISIIAVAQVEEGKGRMVLDRVALLLAGLAPLIAAILMGALGLSGSLLEAAGCCAGPRPVAAVEPTPVAPAPQFAPTPAVQPEPAPAPAPKPARTHQPAPAAPAEPPVNDVERQLENLKRLADKGLITSEEYAAKKRDFLSRL